MRGVCSPCAYRRFWKWPKCWISPRDRALSCCQDQLHEISSAPGELRDTGAGLCGPSFLTALRRKVRPRCPPAPPSHGAVGALLSVCPHGGLL